MESLRLHTIQQAIDDLAYFAYNVNLPMPGGDKVTPDEAPWILVGGSYAGMTHSAHQKVPAGVDWMHGNQVHSQVGRWSSKFLLLFLPPNLSSECCSKPGVFFAGYASSAVVEAIL